MIEALAHGLAAGQPWLRPLAAPAEQVLQALRQGATVAQALNKALASLAEPPKPGGRALCFVAQQALPAGQAYEAFIAATGQVPTRDNLHDLFNGLIWLTQPRLKQALNRLQAGEILRAGVQAQRGPLRDALTLMDENGAWLQAPAVLTQALAQRDWQALFVTHRPLWAQARWHLVGHALLEKLVTAPRKALTAHVVLGDPTTMAADDWAAKPFAPLPVLGLPGWWPANESPAFYDDAAVFRPPRPADQAGKKPSIDK